MNILFLNTLFFYIRESIAAIGVLVIAVGALVAAYQLVMLAWCQKYDANYIRLGLGQNIILGLEFMVGADIIGSLFTPDYYNLGLLAIIVVVRSFLSYFLNLELEALSGTKK